MDRVFLEYYEDELTHVRGLASEFAKMHPAIARNLSLDTVPCPDPYVERLLDGVAFLAARTRLKVDAERTRFARAILDVLYPDMVAPAPAVGMGILKPGQQVQTMLGGHTVVRGTRMVAGLRPGLSTRCTYTTAQDVTLWPIQVNAVSYYQDRSAMAAAGLRPASGGQAECAFRITIGRTGKGGLNELPLDRLDLCFAGRPKAAAIFDAMFGACSAICARPAQQGATLADAGLPRMVGIDDSEALLPRTRETFEGYRLLREYFVMPERFHFLRVDGLRPTVQRSSDGMDVIFFFRRPAPELADAQVADFELFGTPIVNLFERECNVFEVDFRKTRQVLHADRTRPRDFEIYRILNVEDADVSGPEASLPQLFSLGQNRGSGWVYSTERRPRRPAEDEQRQGMTRTSYTGDDVFMAVSRPVDGAAARDLKRLDVRALCTNRDLPILDDSPNLTFESGDPVDAVRLLGAVRPPQPGISAAMPTSAEGESRAEELAWRLISQLSLNFLSLAKEGQGADPLHALLDLYADRGDARLSRHVRSIVRIDSRPVVERLPIPGPMCFGRGTEIMLHVDQSALSGQSALLLSALLARVFTRHAGINGFVRTKTRLLQRQEEVEWPIMPGNRHLI